MGEPGGWGAASMDAAAGDLGEEEASRRVKLEGTSKACQRLCFLLLQRETVSDGDPRLGRPRIDRQQLLRQKGKRDATLEMPQQRGEHLHVP